MQQNTTKYDLINSLFVCSGPSLIEGHIEKKLSIYNLKVLILLKPLSQKPFIEPLYFNNL